MTPTIGRIVHYQTYGTPGNEHVPEPTAAIVTGVKPMFGRHGRADLCVFYPNGLSYKLDVPVSDTPKPGHWNWPPRSES
jgi:hypothetical protein